MKKVIIFLLFLVLSASSSAGESYFDRAQKLFKEEKVENANKIVEVLKKELEINEDNAAAIRLLGIIYQQVGKYELALTQYKQYAELNTSGIDAYVVYNKAVCYYSLNQFNKSKQILVAYSAFFKNSENYNFMEFYNAAIRLSRIENLSVAYNIVASEKISSIEGYIFLAIDEENYSTIKDDSEVSPFVHTELGTTHGSMYIILIPTAAEIQNRYCLHFDWEKPDYLVSVNINEIQDVSVEELNEAIERSKKTFSEANISEMNVAETAWQSVEITSDNGNTFTAYMKAK